MSEKHLAERLMYPLPDGWQQDHEQVAALKEIWPKVIAKNKELIDAEITKLKSQLEEARAENEKLGKLVYVPGLWRCPKCEFQLMQANLNANDGSVTARDQPGDKCPNCDSPLWRVTERDAGNKLIDDAERVCLESKSRVEEARAKAIEECACISDGYYSEDNECSKAIRALLNRQARSVLEASHKGGE